MILWTVMPPEEIFPDTTKLTECEQIDYFGCSVFAEKVASDEYRIVRILSTDPADFLRPDLQPGKLFTYRPTVLRKKQALL